MCVTQTPHLFISFFKKKMSEKLIVYKNDVYAIKKDK